LFSEPGAIVVQCVTVTAEPERFAVVALGDETVQTALIEKACAATPPFDEWRGGTGLALPVARRIIEGHGGALWSADGTRAASAFRLPLAS
jgi:K+-sensing histidine kinase KdpD